MGADAIQALTLINAILKFASSWPVGVVLVFIFVSPWFMLLIISRALDKRVGIQKKMYENNIKLVENYETLADELTSIIHLNTQVQTQLVEKIKNNMFCPMVRDKGPHGG